jgi:hypothetical protein
VVLTPLVFTLIWFWNSPLHLFLTFVIPVVPLFFAWDGYVSCIRGRTPREIRALLDPRSNPNRGQVTEAPRQQNGTAGLSANHEDDEDPYLSRWDFRSGETLVLPPFGYLYWFMGVKSV